MKVFISWSGQKSRDVAHAFRDWLPSVLHAVEPFVSSKDIRAGTRWQAEIASELNETDFGLICVTKENRTAEWLNFEAGALAKAVDSSRVVPLAIDLAPADITNPLGQFQAIRPVKDDVTAMLISMNEVCAPSIGEENLRKGVAKWWSDLETELVEISARTYESSVDESPARSDRDLLEEVLESVRDFGRSPASTPQRAGWSRSFSDELAEIFSNSGVRGWSASIDGSNINVTLRERPPTDAVLAAHRLAEQYAMTIRLNVQSDEDAQTD